MSALECHSPPWKATPAPFGKPDLRAHRGKSESEIFTSPPAQNPSDEVSNLLKLAQGLFNFRKIRKLFRGGRLLAVLHDTVLVDHKRRPRCCVTYAGQHGEN